MQSHENQSMYLLYPNLGSESTFWKSGIYFVSWPAEGKSIYLLYVSYVNEHTRVT